jgi:hypothetical protein
VTCALQWRRAPTRARDSATCRCDRQGQDSWANTSMSILISISSRRISLWKRTTRHSAKRAGEEKESFPQSHRQAAVARQVQMSRQAAPAEDAPFRLSSKELDMMYVHKHSCPIRAVILAPEVLPKAPPPSCPHNPTDLFPNLLRSKHKGGPSQWRSRHQSRNGAVTKNKRRSDGTAQSTGPPMDCRTNY